MMQMSKKNGASPPREPSASAIREAARESVPAAAPSPPARARRKTYTAEYKQRVLREADAAIASGEPGALGALVRREGLYSSHLGVWRRQRDRGELRADAAEAGSQVDAQPARRRERSSASRERAAQARPAQGRDDHRRPKKLSLLLGLTRPDDATAEKKR